jgi:hypothetical protein
MDIIPLKGPTEITIDQTDVQKMSDMSRRRLAERGKASAAAALFNTPGSTPTVQPVIPQLPDNIQNRINRDNL